MSRTIFVLVASVLLVPAVTYYDTTLSNEQWALIKTLTLAMVFAASYCFVVSQLTGNFSQVDKLWSILPAGYVWYVAVKSGYEPRGVLMAVLATIWAARLTFNFARRGGYHVLPWRGEEDYRWAVLRATPTFKKPMTWVAFNLFFISFYQNALILAFTLPSVAAVGGRAIGWLDIFAAGSMLLFVGIETLADQQQYNFQTEKYRRIAANEPLVAPFSDGFCAQGLWARVRHPNYASEQAIWIGFYLFSVAASGRWVNWSLIGALLLVLLFIGSADFSEKISASKYPKYADYLKRVPRFVPKFW